ncbi:MDR family MFS transporter [Auritidibacter ignavus]|uniref:MDR family MFS transporter n=1 Tax=Auritidibacter ignavus TaxID=678932 RepID=UPI00244C5A4B|nr:DHA2 family efflux MFS transporter permease subunit [Auritidibacter ignavus]WGH82958.1 DHA2 family efflux MFS transporter permease subunit [Auritidibacter ignavus]
MGVLSIVALGSFVMILNETIMSVALPVLMGQFQLTAATVQWLTTAFMLTMAVVIPTTGWLLTRVPIRTVFLLSTGFFVFGTAVAGTAPVFSLLVTGRVIQAAGTAIMLPLMMTTMLTVVPLHLRGRTMGIVSIIIAVAPAVGPTAGGLILHWLNWRWMFFFILPIGALVMLLGWWRLRDVTETRKVPLDVFSVVLSAIGFAGVIYGLSSIGEAATGNAVIPPWVPLVAGAIALVIFTGRQLSLQDFALLNLRVFAVPTFTLSTVCVLIAMVGLFGVIVILPIYMQDILNFSTQDTGLALLPGGIVMAGLGWLIGRAYDSVGARPLLIPGSLLVSAGMWLMTTFDANTSIQALIATHVVMSVGLACLMGPLFTSALNSLTPQLYSHGSATINTLQQVAAAGGTSLYITVMTVATTLGVGRGQDPAVAEMTGIHHALLCGAVLSLVTVGLVPCVKTPTPVT